jgi:hypothetical protein
MLSPWIPLRAFLGVTKLTSVIFVKVVVVGKATAKPLPQRGSEEIKAIFRLNKNAALWLHLDYFRLQYCTYGR